MREEITQITLLIYLTGCCLVTISAFGGSSIAYHFGLASLAARNLQYDLMFIANVHNHNIDSVYLLEVFSCGGSRTVFSYGGFYAHFSLGGSCTDASSRSKD